MIHRGVQYDMLQCLRNTVKDVSLSYAFVYSANISRARSKPILQITFQTVLTQREPDVTWRTD
jgi:hypothetical protein